MRKWSHSAEGTVQLEAQRHTEANSIKDGNQLRFEIEPRQRYIGAHRLNQNQKPATNETCHGYSLEAVSCASVGQAAGSRTCSGRV